MEQPIADLHCHPSTKALLGNHRNLEIKAWFSYNFMLKALFGAIAADEAQFAGDAIDSQSSLRQVEEGNGSLIFWTFHPIEKPYIENKHIKKLLTTAHGVNSKLVGEYLEKIGNVKYVKKNIDYHKIMTEYELPLYLKTLGINRIDSKSPKLKPNTLNVCLCVEGAHSFLDSKDDLSIENGVKEDKYIKRFKDFVQRKSIDIKYFTLAHIAPNGLYNNCFAGKLVEKHQELVKFLPREIDPSGINNLGNKVLDLCIGYKIHPDLKHMSYRARVTIYDKLEILQSQNKPFPAPIASHMGVFGNAEKGMLPMLKSGRPKLLKVNDGGKTHLLVECRFKRRKNRKYKTDFHRRTISLLDDDIQRIAKLGGIIGFIIDQRVLGYGTTADREDVDVLTYGDFVWLCNRKGVNPSKYFVSNDRIILESKATLIKQSKSRVEYPLIFENDSRDRKGAPISRRNIRHLKAFCHNILYTLDVLKKHNIPNPYKHVCFGSDYDGLVDAVNCCKSFADMQSFIQQIQEYLDGRKFEQTYGISSEDFLDMFFYKNVVNFFKLSPGSPVPPTGNPLVAD